jgi:phosphinothricin acetyltransferase
MKIRMASVQDAAAIAAIYAPFCETNAVSFEVVAPSPGEMASRVQSIAAQFPWLVAEVDGGVAGYAYAGRHHERAAYQWSVNTGIYIGESHRKKGVGTALYSVLFELLRLQGYYKACAGITLPNPASIALHERAGFTPVGIFRGIGFKQGEWRDVAWYEAEVQPERSNPGEPLPVTRIQDTAEWRRIMSRGA